MVVVASSNYPFNGSVLSNTDWESYAGLFRSDGVVRGQYSELAVTQHTGPNMSVDVAAGVAFIRGTYGAWSITSNLPIASNASGNTRIDLIVAVLDVVNSRMYLDVVQGTPSGAPAAPALTINSSIKQMALATVTVASGAISIVNANLGDVRWASSGPGSARGFTLTAVAAVTLYGDTEHPSNIVLPVTGATGITSITAQPAGSRLVIEAVGTLNVVAGSNLKMPESFVGAALSTLSFESDGTNWIEVGRGAPTGAAGLVLATPDAASGGAILRTLGRSTAASIGAATNYVINPSFEIWQRGVSFDVVTLGGTVYTADRWLATHAGTGGAGSMMVTQDSGQTEVGGGSYTMKVVLTTWSQASFIIQRVENNYDLRARPMVLQMRVNCSVLGTARIQVDTDAGTFISALNQSTNTWETLTVVVTPGGQTRTDIYIRLEGNGTFYFDQVQLVLGQTAPLYTPLLPSEDLARCQRYYEPHGFISGALQQVGYANGVGQPVGGWQRFATTKGGTPTVTRLGSWSLTGFASTPTVTNPNPDGYFLNSLSTAAGTCTYSSGGVLDGVTAAWNPP